MRNMRKLTCLMLALLLCTVMAVPVFALSNSGLAGIYVKISGTATVSEIGSGLDTLTSVKKNPDSAYLVTTAEFSNGVYSFGTYDAQSARAVTTFSYTFPVPLMGGFPNYVYTCHEVRGGTTSPEAYAARCEGSMVFS